MISLDGLGASTDEVVLLVGAGSVANAWEPVLDALGRRLPDRSAESANVYFATLVQRLRWLSALAARDTSRTSDYRRELSVALHEYQRVITDISQRLQDAKLELRSEATVLREKLLDGFTAKIVSTNWDFTADELVKDDQDSSIDHIHGTFSVGLYLPNEVADEPYRDPDNRREFSTSMLSTVPSLICAQRLVVYGLSVSPLDAELGFVLQWANKQRHQPFEEVFVVDPNATPVLNNLRVHLGVQNYVSVHPTELESLRVEPATRWR